MCAQLIGDTRSAMTNDLLTRKIYNIISDAKRDRPSLKKYYIFISAKPDQFLCNVIREGVVVTNVKPPKALNSMCFYVDTISGRLDALWALPIDLGSSVDHLIGDEFSQGTATSLRGLGTNILS
jgi:hypothetical protein